MNACGGTIALPVGGWRTSSRCGPNGGNCVEVNLGTGHAVGVRDTKPAVSDILMFGAAAWRTFVKAATGADLQP